MNIINANQIVERARFNAFHVALILLGFLIIMVDGYDIVIYGTVVPVLMKEWSISPVIAGAIGSYTTIGQAVGALVFGYAADKLGRKKVIIICVALFSVFTALAGVTDGPVLFTVFRIIAGLGLGGVMPIVIALTAEYSPNAVRTALVSFVFCGYSIGGITAGFVSKAFLPEMGWRPVFWLALIALLLLPFLAKMMPESYRLLIKQQKNKEVGKILKKVNPEYRQNEDDKFATIQEVNDNKFLISKIFENKRAFSTVMFWIVCASCFILISTINTWLPGLMMKAGYDLRSSLMFIVVVNAGAILGTIIFGILVDKWGFKKILIPLFLCGSLALILIGFNKNIWLVYLLVAMVGAASIGIQNIMSASVAQYYPPEVRSTAVGMLLSIGRIGAIVAPTLVGVLISLNLPFQMNFVVVSMAGIIGAVALLLVQEQNAHYKKEADKVEVNKSING